MISRRNWLRLSAGGTVLFACRAFGVPATLPMTPAPTTAPKVMPFSPQALLDAAKAAASSAYRPPIEVPLDAAGSIDLDRSDAAHMLSERSLFYNNGGASIHAALRPRLGGDARSFPLNVYKVDGGNAVPVPYDAGAFDFGGIDASTLPPTLGFGGFDLRAASDRVGRYETLLRFDRTDMLRLLHKRRFCGVGMRPFAFAPGDGENENYPAVRAAYIQRPDADRCTVYLTLDGPGGAGVYVLRLHAPAGTAPTITLEGTLYPRGKPVRPCLLPMAASVYDTEHGLLNRSVDALLLHNAAGEVLWRPLRNRRRLNVSVFLDQGVRMLGLVRRRTAPALFEAPEQNDLGAGGLVFYPTAGFDRGRTVLTEVPAPAPDVHNVLLHREVDPPAAGPIVFAGRLAPFLDAPIESVPLRVAFFRHAGDRLSVHFTGGDYLNGNAPTPEVTTSSGAVSDVTVVPYDDGRSLRVGFRCALQGASVADVRVRLLYAGRGISEVWTSPLFADDAA